MQTNRNKAGVVFAVTLSAVFLPAIARADKALVIGVNKYPNLNGANLAGCVNDAKSMVGVLEKYGFQVRTIFDEGATKAGILNAIAAMKKEVGANERFAIYFAGHGTRESDGQGALLPHDARQDSEANDIKKNEFYDALVGIPAKSKTVIMDSCFSGGMMRSAKSLMNTRKNMKTRFFKRDGKVPDVPKPGSKDLVMVNRSDVAADIPAGSRICYYAAARENEQAAEDEFPGGERHGVFTYYLMNRLKGESDIWGDVHKNVAGNVRDKMQDTQTPLITSDFVDRLVFERAGAKPPVNPPQKESSLWDELSGDRADPSKVSITISPNQTSFKLRDEITFTTKVGEKGYLMIIERGISGNINLLYPARPDAEAGQVENGTTISIPDPGKVYINDRPGTERVKAILFTSRSRYEEIIKKFAPTQATGLGDPTRSLTKAQMKRDLVKMDRSTMYTSDIIFEVVDLKQGLGEP